MSRSFEQWFNSQRRTETKPAPTEPEYRDDDELYFRCSCGKIEVVTYGAFESGDTGWYVEDIEKGHGLCGSQYCMP